MAKKKVSEIVSGAGFAADFWTRLDKAIRARGGDDEDVYRIGTKEGEHLIEEIADLIVSAGRPQQIFPVTVNYDLTVEEMIEAGKYDWKNPDITSDNFPVTRRGTSEVEIHLVHFDRVIETEEVLRELDKMGLRPAELPELLALGAGSPDLQRQFPIIALGSVFRRSHGHRHAPVLWGGSGRRYLGLHWLGDRWNAYDRFAAVRK